MKKIILIFIAVLSVLQICYSSASAMGRMKKNDVELTFWHSMSIYQGDILEKLVKEYNESHEYIKINPVFQGLYDEMKIKLSGAVKSGDMPDIAQVAIEYLDVFINDDKIEPITGLISGEDKNDILSQFWNGVSRNREIYAFPFNMSVQVLYYNKDAYRKAGIDPGKPPKTWEEAIEYGKMLTKDFNGNGSIDQWGILVSMEGIFGFTPLIRQVGGEILNENR